MSSRTRPAARAVQHAPMREGAVVQLDDGQDELAADVVIVGSGMGGGTLAHALAGGGLDVLIVERGEFLPREAENFDPAEMFVRHRYRTSAPWIDGSTGKEFQPGVYHWVGGNTKMYGACLPRFRKEDFEAFETADGTSPAWPFSYDDLEPFYGRAEALFRVHGALGEDPTEPFHSTPYAHAALEHEPVIERFAESLRNQGLHPFHMSSGMVLGSIEDRRAATAADGTPMGNDSKSDAENSVVRPALEHDNVRILTGTTITRLETDASGARVVAATGEHRGRPIRITGSRFAVAAGAVNSSVLLLASATHRHPDGLGNSSGLLGRNYMVHNSTFFVGVNPFRINDTAWQKTLGLNDWYLASEGTPFPLGNLQMLGKLQGAHFKGARAWVPQWLLDRIAHRSIDIYLTTEDLPREQNRVRVRDGRTVIDWSPTNLGPHREFVKRMSKVVRRAGYPIILTERMGIATNSHMCGTAVAGDDPRTSVLDRDCRSHDVENLWVVDGSFFASSAALNPALTIAANALRVAPAIAAAT